MGTGFLNPGIASTTDPMPDEIEQDRRYCKKCRTVNVEHCHICDVCCKDLDHHCGVIGKCIGRGNLYCFYAFVCWSAISMSYLYIMLGFSGEIATMMLDGS